MADIRLRSYAYSSTLSLSVIINSNTIYVRSAGAYYFACAVRVIAAMCLFLCLCCSRPQYGYAHSCASICVYYCAHTCASVVVNTRFYIHSTFANAAGLLALKILERGIITIAFLFEILAFLCTKTITLWSWKKTNALIEKKKTTFWLF